MSKFIFLLVLIHIVAAKVDNLLSNCGLNEIELTSKYKYPLEIHNITTDDGYILTVYRIPYGRHDKTNIGKRPPVLMISGMTADSSSFLIYGNRRSLGFLLADNGFDVWLGNLRGCGEGRKHKNLDPDINKKEFWDFSLEEFAIYDVPNTIDYVSNVTKQEKLFFHGYSLGATVYFIMTSEKPKYNDKIVLSSLFAPPVYAENVINSLYATLLTLRKDFEQSLNFLRVHEIFALNSIIAIAFYILCVYLPFAETCNSIITEVAGSSAHTDFSLITVILTIFPNGTSSKVILHYLQMDGDKLFAKYNYGKKENMKRYGQPMPPEFNISASTAPVAIYYGTADTITSPADVEILLTKLPNLATVKRVEGYGHLDFSGIADTAAKEVYAEVIKNMKKHLE